MRQKRAAGTGGGEKTIRDIRRATRRQYSAEEKIRIVLDGLRGEDSFAELCRREGINQNLYYRWSKEFLKAGKKRLAGDTAPEATSEEVKGLRRQAHPPIQVSFPLHHRGQWYGYPPLRHDAQWFCEPVQFPLTKP